VPAELTDRFNDALTWAAKLHQSQTRKASQIPYVTHLLSVAALVLEHGGGEDEAIAALLHDAIEDQGGQPTRLKIAARFGPRVAAIVEGATETDLQPKPPWRERKEAHLAHLAGADRSVQLVVAADKLHNARSLLADHRRLGEAVWSHFRGGRSGTLWYFRQVLGTLKLAPPELVAQIEETVNQLERAGDEPR
jgi:(p)ppGpp synthase/HD superfamily hydrolase